MQNSAVLQRFKNSDHHTFIEIEELRICFTGTK